MRLHALPECSELLVCIIAATLERRSARRTDAQFKFQPPQSQTTQSSLAAFNSDQSEARDYCSAAVVSLLDLVTQVSDACSATPCVLIAALVLLDRMSNALALTERNVCRIFSVAVSLATKYVEDIYNTNAHYARIIGVTLQCYNTLEVLFLRAIGFDCRVSSAELAAMDMSAISDACQSCYGQIIQPAIRDAIEPQTLSGHAPVTPPLSYTPRTPTYAGPPGFPPLPPAVLSPVLSPVLPPVLPPVLAPVVAPVLLPVIAPVLPPVLAPMHPPVLPPGLPPVLHKRRMSGCGSSVSSHSPLAVQDATLSSPGSVCTLSPMRLARVSAIDDVADEKAWLKASLSAPSYQYFDRLLELADRYDQSEYESTVDDSDDVCPAWAGDSYLPCDTNWHVEEAAALPLGTVPYATGF